MLIVLFEETPARIMNTKINETRFIRIRTWLVEKVLNISLNQKKRQSNKDQDRDSSRVGGPGEGDKDMCGGEAQNFQEIIQI